MQTRLEQLRAILLGLLTLPVAALPGWAEQAVITSHLKWTHDATWFGGLSGAEVSTDGKLLTVITDRGSLITAELKRSDDTISIAEITHRQHLRASDGTLLKGAEKDPEGLALTDQGLAYIAFEWQHRISTLDMSTGRTHALNAHPDFLTFPSNAGLEALAVDANGALFALPEQVLDAKNGIPLYRFSNDQWQILTHLPQRGLFQSVGADFDDKGRLYLLERAITPIGFFSRIRRFDLNTLPAQETTLLTSKIGQFHNLEALTFWRDTNGRARLILVSDDNFSSLLRTELVEITLTEPLALHETSP